MTRQNIKHQPRLRDSAANASLSSVVAQPTLREALPIDRPGSSPARMLQARLDAFEYPSHRRWSARRTVAFVAVTCGGAWLAAFLALRALA